MSTDSCHPTPSNKWPSALSIKAAIDARLEGASGIPWVHPICKPLATDRKGPFLNLPDGSLLTIDNKELSVSRDEGKTWGKPLPVALGQEPAGPAGCYLVETADGTLVMVYLNTQAHGEFRWNGKTGEPEDSCRFEIYAARSTDRGKTWTDCQSILDGCNANFFGFIRTSRGSLIAVAPHLVTKPGRWVVCSLVSEDDGKTWRRSNLIDLGGRGHHDGALEPTVAELSDGRLLMLIRTNLDFLWQAVSDDGGRYWRTIGPSKIDASGAPGHLVRLQSGRLLLVWNRRNPEDCAWPLSWNEHFFEVPCSWHREELSISIIDDDGRMWSKPIVIARLRGGQLSYPYVFERRAGELWVIAGIASAKWFDSAPVPFAAKIQEQELLREIAKEKPRS